MMKGMISMNAKINAQNLNPYESNSSIQFSLELPTKCPCCGTTYSRTPEYTNFFQNDSGIIIANSTYFCPTCENCFFVVYLVKEDFPDLYGYPLTQYPEPSEFTSFSKELSTLTPKFVEIYHQAEKAENSGLTELCGIGYRKALEFLVKDYAISQHPDKESEIVSSFLGNCINDFIDNEKIKTLAKASAWLGNDETHYTRKHPNYNIQDLKRFIKTTVAYIECELSFTEAFDFLNNPQQ